MFVTQFFALFLAPYFFRPLVEDTYTVRLGSIALDFFSNASTSVTGFQSVCPPLRLEVKAKSQDSTPAATSMGSSLSWIDVAPLHWRAAAGLGSAGSMQPTLLDFELGLDATTVVYLNALPPDPKAAIQEIHSPDTDIVVNIPAAGGNRAHPPECFRGRPGAPPWGPAPRPLSDAEKRRLRRTYVSERGGQAKWPPPKPLAVVTVRVPAQDVSLLRRGLAYSAAVLKRCNSLKSKQGQRSNKDETITAGLLEKAIREALAPSFDGSSFRMVLPTGFGESGS